MKRAPNPNKAPSDFKRLKAKVGKRAPQRLNATDTKFRTATVQVQSQSISKEHDTENAQQGLLMMSSKGKEISQLIAQMNHPAANARSSALQGMRDAIKHTPANVIPQHLALIIPSLSKCIADEDSDVRKMSMTILFQEVSSRIASVNMGDRMRPFLALILAYIGSALHSLDQDVRYDGCLALETLCTYYHDLFMDGGDEIVKLQATIPAFTILLDDVSGGLASMSRRGVGSLGGIERDKQEKSKNRQKQNKRSLRGVGVLKSFLAVVKTTTSYHNGDGILAEDSQTDSAEDAGNDARLDRRALLPSISRADLIFLKGGRTSNAIVWKKNQVLHSSIRTISKIQDLQVDCHESNEASMGDLSLDLKMQNALFSKLRDRFVEVTQRGQSSEQGIYLSPTDAQEFSLVVSALRLLWSGYSRKVLSGDSGIASDPEFKKVKLAAASILHLLLESFAIKDTSGNDNNRQLYDLLNASICMALSEFGSALDKLSTHTGEAGQQSEWVKAIFAYVVPQLDRESDDDDFRSSSASSNTRLTLIKVIEQLLLQPENSNGHLLEEKKYMELLAQFGGAYFPSAEFDDGICKSTEGRRAVALLVSLINQYLSNTGVVSDEMWSRLSQMASLLSNYLMKWRGAYPKDSTVVLATLLAISRRSNMNDASDESLTQCESITAEFCKSLRSSIEKLFVTSNKMRAIGSTSWKAKTSVFEELSQAGQTIAMSLVGVLRSPSDKLMSSLAQICSRRCCITDDAGSEMEVPILTDAMIDYIMCVVHSMSRTITLQQYLTFLVNSCGIHSAKFTTIAQDSNARAVDSAGFNFICSYDQVISRTCRYILLTKSKNIVPMLKPVLKSWLEDCSGEDLAIRVLKSRVAISILSCHALSLPQDSGTENSIFESDMRDGLVQAIYNLLLSVPFGADNADDSTDSKHIQARLISPVLVSRSMQLL